MLRQRLNLFLQIFALYLAFLQVTSDIIEDENGEPLVSLEIGDLKGTFDFSRDGRKFYAFRGIPYGHVPGRFEDSVEEKSWKDFNRGAYPAVNYDSECIHFDFVSEHILRGSEKCLFLNIFIPKLGYNRTNLPVLFWIHGGGFKSGSSNIYRPKYFMDEEVILVTINYRLGYLNTYDGEYGNMGSKDQVLALKWVQKHIRAFTGDKNKVTIFGESAGAACVHYLVLSPMGKGLFHNAILMSGSANVARAFKEPSNATAAIAKLAGCPIPGRSGSDRMIECLKKMDAKSLLEAQQIYHKSLGNKGKETSFAPSLDKLRSKSETFLPAPPTQLMNKKKFTSVPMIIGICRDEGVFIYGAYLLDNPQKLAELNEDFETHAPTTFDYDEYFPSDRLNEVSSEIKKFYFPKDVIIGPDTAKAVFNLFSDTFIIVAAVKALQAHYKDSHTKVFNYILNYKPEYTYFDRVSGFSQYTSYITHGDDLSLIFNFDMLVPQGTNYSKDFKKVSKGVVKAWATFADYSYPSSWGKDENLWTQYNGLYMDWFSMKLKPEMISESDSFYYRRKFWEELFDKYAH